MTQKKSGRRPLPPAEKVGPEFVGQTPPAMAAQETAVNQLVVAAHSNDLALLNQLLGQAQMADAFAQFAVTVTTSKLAYVKETKLYQSLKGKPTGDGHHFSGTWDEFCGLLGRSREQIDQDILNLRTFGEQALESMSRMGIGYRDFRQFRALPEDGKTALIEVAKKGDKEALLELAEELIAKQESDKKKLVDERDKARNDYEAREKVIQATKDENAKLKEKLARIPKEKPDEKGKAMVIEVGATALGAQKEVKQLATGVQALLDHMSEHGLDLDFQNAIEHHLTGLVGELATLISALDLAGVSTLKERLLVAFGDAE